MTERLSAWMDGELESENARQLFSQLQNNAALRATWDYYHLIGDAVRGVHGPDFCARIWTRLDAEPTVLAPQRRSAAEMLRWRPMQVAASIAAFAFVGGIWMALPGPQPDQQPIAVSPPAEIKRVPFAGKAVQDYLLAHQRYSPSGAMHGVAPYMRTMAESGGPTDSNCN